MELLRIIAIIMILCGHFLTHSLKKDIPFSIYYSLEPLFIDGVNLFFLISGWFGMRLSVKSFVNLLTTVFCFTIIGMLPLCFISPGSIGLEEWMGMVILPVSKSKFWFVMVYMVLLVLSPLLNGGLKSINNRKLTRVVLILTAINIWDCWYGGNYTNVNGYTLSQGIWMYVLANWLHRNQQVFDKIDRKCYILLFVLITIATGLIIIITKKADLLHYNSPLVIASSLVLFLYFTQINFKSKRVNLIATAAFGCYMLQDGYFGRGFLYGEVRNYCREVLVSKSEWSSICMIVLAVLGLVISIWILSLILTPIVNKISAKLTNQIEKISIKKSPLLSRITARFN